MGDYKLDIAVDGKVYPVEVICEYKKRKTLVLRVIPKNMQVRFSMPPGTPESYARKFFEKSRPWLEQQLKSILPGIKKHDYMDGDRFYFLGSELLLKVKKTARNSAYIENGCIILEQKEDLSLDKKKLLIEKMFYRELEPLLQESFAYIAQVFEPYLEKRSPEIKIRKMTAKWGLCRPLKNQMTFSSRLVHVAPCLIDYVMAHELCHFVQANHSSDFWELLAKGMPDWRARRKKLAEVDKYIDI